MLCLTLSSNFRDFNVQAAIVPELVFLAKSYKRFKIEQQ